MRAELQPHIFELFTQAERTSDRTQGGLAIGLALAKNLTELHGGTISGYSAAIGKGSTVAVRLPRHDPLASERAEGAGEGEVDTLTAKQPSRILVVNDNEDAAPMLGLYSESLGHEVQTEYTARGALVRSVVDRPDVYILDIRLPEMDGNELAARLRGQSEQRRPRLSR